MKWGRADSQQVLDLIESAKVTKSGGGWSFSFGDQQEMIRQPSMTTQQKLALGGVLLVLALIVVR